MDLFQVGAAPNHSFQSLRSRLTREQAVDVLSAGLARRLLAGVQHDRLRSIAEVYVPYHLYRVGMSDGRRHQEALFAVDAVTGTLDLYRFDADAADLDVVSVRSRNRIAAELTAAEAWSRIAAQLQRMLFQTGFFTLRHLCINGVREPLDLHLPYWVGFYERGGHVRLDVVDAVRRRIEGAKARALLEGWLAERSGDLAI